jgi:hypothetical protein
MIRKTYNLHFVPWGAPPSPPQRPHTSILRSAGIPTPSLCPCRVLLQRRGFLLPRRASTPHSSGLTRLSSPATALLLHLVGDLLHTHTIFATFVLKNDAMFCFLHVCKPPGKMLQRCFNRTKGLLRDLGQGLVRSPVRSMSD